MSSTVSAAATIPYDYDELRESPLTVPFATRTTADHTYDYADHTDDSAINSEAISCEQAQGQAVTIMSHYLNDFPSTCTMEQMVKDIAEKAYNQGVKSGRFGKRRRQTRRVSPLTRIW